MVACSLITLAGSTASAQVPPPTADDWSAVDRILERTGAAQPNGVMRYSFPRSDLRVTIDDISIRPALALGSWVAFRNVGDGKAMAMGDLVLTEQEVPLVMRALQEGGVEQTALHNHVLRESARIMYLHIGAHGDAASIARTIRNALARTGTPPAAAGSTATAANQPPFDLDTAAIASALGVSGRINGGVYQVGVPRRETIRERGHEVPPAMGVATAINFQPTDEGRAAITGDFVMLAAEVNPVIRALQRGGIAVTALHSHMLEEEPRLFFMHFWANDDAIALARTLRAALDQTNSRLANR